MRAWVRRGGVTRLEEADAPRVERADDVIIEVALAGICRTDLYAARGLLDVADPLILGHEVSGEVVAAGPEARVKEGDRVAVMPVRHCGACAACAAGRIAACPRAQMMGVDLPGAFARYARSPDRFVYPVGRMDHARAAYAEPVAASLAPAALGLDREAPALVVGRGRIAELTARAMRAAGHVHVEVAREAREAHGWEVVVETSGRQEVLDAAIRACAPGGTLVMKSRPAGHVALNLRRAVQKELCLRGAHYAPFGRALELLRDPGFDVSDLLGSTHPLDAFLELAEEGGESGATKTFLDPKRSR
jgi:threonine dehydrogenase-like Zn-dependent dehydrogenase